MQIKVIRAVITAQKMTLVTEDMKTIDIPQGDSRLPIIFDHIKGQLQAQNYAMVPKEMLEVSYSNPDAQFGKYQEESKGLVKFFRVARSVWNKVKDNIFDHEEEPVRHVPDQVLGQEPVVQSAQNAASFVETTPVVVKETVVEKLANSGAKPVTSEKSSTQKLDEAETMLVAVIGGKAIPDAQNIENLVKASNTGDMPKGSVDAFLKRVSAVIDKRRFSGEDLMTFMRKGDLPITIDGCLLVYKRVNQRNDYFVDCHTGYVKQTVGTVVSMDEDQVDPSRSQDCSMGLHIASRNYVRGFTGSVLLLCKVKPENVIAVPQYDVTKMRCSAYEILTVIPGELANEVYGTQPITTPALLEIIRKGIFNEYPAPTKSTHIKGSKAGEGTMVYSDLLPASVKTETVTVEVPVEKTKTVEVVVTQLETSEQLQQSREAEKEKTVVAAKVAPSQIKSPKVGKKLSTSEEAKQLWEAFVAAKKAGVRKDTQDAARELQFFKTSKKKGWVALGLDHKTSDKLKPWLE